MLGIKPVNFQLSTIRVKVRACHLDLFINNWCGHLLVGNLFLKFITRLDLTDRHEMEQTY